MSDKKKSRKPIIKLEETVELAKQRTIYNEEKKSKKRKELERSKNWLEKNIPSKVEEVQKEIEILDKDTPTKREYFIKLNEIKNSIKKNTIDFAITIKEIRDIHNVTQEELSEELGISQSTISRWIKIGSHRMVSNYTQQLPMSFNALYELTNLESKMKKDLGQREGVQRFNKLFESKMIVPEMFHDDVAQLVNTYQKKQKLIKKKKTEQLFHESDSKTLTYEDKVYDLKTLVETKKWFNTIVLIPSIKQLKEWKELNMSSYINENYPITDLRNVTHTSSITFLMKVKVEFLDTALKCLTTWGFNYKDTYLPTQKSDNFESGKNKFVVLRGERGAGGFKDKPLTIKSEDTNEIMKYAESIGNKPYVLIGENEERKDWTICID